jgi:hypothetical protein
VLHGNTRKRSVDRLAGTALEGGNVFPNQLLDALAQISMAHGLAHATRLACDTPNLNSPPERVQLKHPRRHSQVPADLAVGTHLMSTTRLRTKSSDAFLMLLSRHFGSEA